MPTGATKAHGMTPLKRFREKQKLSIEDVEAGIEKTASDPRTRLGWATLWGRAVQWRRRFLISQICLKPPAPTTEIS